MKLYLLCLSLGFFFHVQLDLRSEPCLSYVLQLVGTTRTWND